MSEYTERCRACGIVTDSTFCSTRCELDDLARAAANKEDEPEEQDPEPEHIDGALDDAVRAYDGPDEDPSSPCRDSGQPSLEQISEWRRLR